MESIKNFLLSKYFLAFAFAAHALVLLVLYLKFGINLSNEGEKYLQVAGRLNFENYREELQYLWAYSFYIVFLTVCLKSGFSVYVIIVIQYLVSVAGFYLFYKFILSQNFFSKLYARICWLVIITCPVIIYWQLTFYTETFFIALVMISTYCAFKPITNYLPLIVLFPALLFCRPVGVFYMIALSAVLLKKQGFKFTRGFLYASFGLVFFIVLFLVPLHFYDFALPIFQGSVICGFPMFPASVLPEGNYFLAQIHVSFIEEHGLADLLIISLKKIAAFFTITRPYYSFSHNAINSVYYLFIIGGLLGIGDTLKRNSHPLFYGYFTSVLTASLLIVVLIYNEWSERFMVPLLPFFILMTFIFIFRIRIGTVLPVVEPVNEKPVITI